MTTIDFMDIRNEICHYMRGADILSTTIRGVTRTSSNYTVPGGGEAAHTFTGRTPTRDFHSLTVDAIPKYYLRDYTMNWNTGVLTWNVALTAGQVVAYEIDWGTSDKVFPDMPRDDLTLTSFPRVGIELTSATTVPYGLGGMQHLSDFLITIMVWAPANKDTNIASGFGGTEDLEDTMTLIREAIRTNAKSFYTFQYITPSGVSPMTRGTNGKIIQHSQDFKIKFRIE